MFRFTIYMVISEFAYSLSFLGIFFKVQTNLSNFINTTSFLNKRPADTSKLKDINSYVLLYSIVDNIHERAFLSIFVLKKLLDLHLYIKLVLTYT